MPTAHVPPPPLDEVLARLDALEAEHDVRVLFACESGSRAWGFASTDSDYDVRFIYVHRLEWYLSIDRVGRRDVIELPIEGPWDVNGWDLRKALGLLAKSNPPLLEWLGSPLVYREDVAFTPRLRELAAAYYAPRSCRFHYLHMASGNHREYLKGDVVWRKKYFYLLRPLFACRWIERDLGPVPMEFERLLYGLELPAEVIAATERLLIEKRAGDELGKGPADPVLNAYIDEERLHQKTLVDERPPHAPPDVEPLNELFRAAVLGR